MKYELKVTETNNKAGKFLYQIIDENGQVVSERRSNRVYVAALPPSGSIYFGRLDLIGKGEHGRDIKFCIAESFAKELPNHAKSSYTLEQYRAIYKQYVENLNNIAYIKP